MRLPTITGSQRCSWRAPLQGNSKSIAIIEMSDERVQYFRGLSPKARGQVLSDPQMPSRMRADLLISTLELGSGSPQMFNETIKELDPNTAASIYHKEYFATVQKILSSNLGSDWLAAFFNHPNLEAQSIALYMTTPDITCLSIKKGPLLSHQGSAEVFDSIELDTQKAASIFFWFKYLNESGSVTARPEALTVELSAIARKMKNADRLEAIISHICDADEVIDILSQVLGGIRGN
jgi:hypothetical protein